MILTIVIKTILLFVFIWYNKNVYHGEAMFESNFKFPKFFIYMQLALSLIIFVGMFFSIKLVAGTYFVAILITAVFLILDKKYGSILTNYKLTFLLFDIVNLIAIIAITYYEFVNHSTVLNVFLFILIAIETVSACIDIFVIKNKNVSSRENILVDVVKLSSMICILTYFFNVSDLFFAIDALIFEVASFVLKLYVNKSQVEPKSKELTPEKSLEQRIHSAGVNEGEVE